MSRPYLIWSIKWSLWHRPGTAGYTCEIAQAGVFTEPWAKHRRDGVARQVFYDEAFATIEKRRAELDAERKALDAIWMKLRTPLVGADDHKEAS